MDSILERNPELKTELDSFKRLNSGYYLSAGKVSGDVESMPYHILYMAMSASLAMDLSENDFFDNFVLCDKSITGTPEYLIDAYAFIDTETSNEKHLHLFQFKIHESEQGNAISPKELNRFCNVMNNVFVHPELMEDEDLKKPTLNEIYDLIQSFLKSKKSNKNRIKTHCHYINNAQGITASNKKEIESVINRFQKDKQENRFSIQIYGLKDILDLSVSGKKTIEEETILFSITEKNNGYLLENNIGKDSQGLPTKVFVGVSNVNELIKLQDKYNRNQLYNENIRLYLGDRSAVNKDIGA